MISRIVEQVHLHSRTLFISEIQNKDDVLFYSRLVLHKKGLYVNCVRKATFFAKLNMEMIKRLENDMTVYRHKS